MATDTQHWARVKSVTSGDTLILASLTNPEREKTLSLAFVSAPRLRREGDEPFAFQSREFLRSKFIGKTVQFRVLYSVQSTKREYGLISTPTGEQFPLSAVAGGYVKVRDDAGRKETSDESRKLIDDLKDEEATAKSASRGLWSNGDAKIQVYYEIPEPKVFLEKRKGQRLDAIIERVLAGDRMLVRLILSPTTHLQTFVVVGGIKAPAFSRTNPTDGKVQPADPFGIEAQQFVETRLLHRRLEIEVLGLTPQNTLIGSVFHPNGSIATFLLKSGLAQCLDMHSALLGSNMSVLRQAEKEAKGLKVGLFKGHVDQKVTAGETDATVTRVHNADTLYIRGRSGDERRVSISSVRQPKPKDPQQSPFSADAKEFLRKKLIGKHVKVTVDGRKAANEGFEEQDAVTVNVNGKNIALQLVEAGYASVIRHPRDSTDRSPVWDELIAAEAQAQSEGKGMWSSKPPAAKVYQDYSESLQKAKVQCAFLQRQKKIPAVVDFVKGGSRFTVLIPRENAKLTLVISGIRCPRSARSANEKSEPFGQEAHDFANRRCNQRDVEIEVETTDKIGGFIGSLFVNRENFAKLLLEDGLATVHAYSAEQSGNANELFAAEEKAKAAKRGLWHDYDPSQDPEADVGSLSLNDTLSNGGSSSKANGSTTSHAAAGSNGTAAAPPKKDYRDVTVTHIDPETLHLKLQLVGASNSHALNSLMTSFAAYHNSSAAVKTLPSAPPKTGEIVAARYSLDNQWYRARVRSNDRDAKKSGVFFVDYGNTETVPWDGLRPLGDLAKFGLAKFPAQAVDAALSFVQFSSSPEYRIDAVNFLTTAAGDGKALVASVEHVEKNHPLNTGGNVGGELGGTWWITLFDPEKSEDAETGSVNAEVIAEGHAMVSRKLQSFEAARPGTVKALKGKEEAASRDHKGMWEYGDITED